MRTSWAILRHAALLLLRNLPMALRLSLGPLVILWILNLSFGGMIGLGADSPVPFGAASSWLLGLIDLFIMAWLCVAWHRHILLEERPEGLLPVIEGPEILAYAMWSFLVSLTLTILGGVTMPVLFEVTAALPLPVTLAAGFAGVTGLAWLGLRLGLVLPGAAVGRRIDLAESWGLTSPIAGALWGVAAVAVALALAATFAVGSVVPYRFYEAAFAAMEWLGLMGGLCGLTTLYGMLVERRRLG